MPKNVIVSFKLPEQDTHIFPDNADDHDIEAYFRGYYPEMHDFEIESIDYVTFEESEV